MLRFKIALCVVLFLACDASASWTSADLGLVAGDQSKAAVNSAALQAALSAGKHVRLLPGTYYIEGPIRVSCGMPCRLSGEIGATRYDPASLTRLTAVNDGAILEIGGPDAPNGAFGPAARGVTIEDVQFCKLAGKAVAGLAIYQAEQFVVRSCEFQQLDVGLLIQSQSQRRCLGGLIQSIQGNGCGTAYKIVGEPGQTFGEFTFLSCNAEGGSIGWLFDRSGAECQLIGCTAQAQTMAGVKADNGSRLVITGGYHEPGAAGAGLIAANGCLVALHGGTWGPVECDATSTIESLSFRRVGGIHAFTRGPSILGKTFDPPSAECWGPPSGPNNALWYPPSGSGAAFNAVGHVVRDGQGVEWRCVTAGDNAAQRWQPTAGEVRIPIVGGTSFGDGYYSYSPQLPFVPESVRLVVTSQFAGVCNLRLTQSGSIDDYPLTPTRTLAGSVLSVPVESLRVHSPGWWTLAVTQRPTAGAGYLIIKGTWGN